MKINGYRQEIRMADRILNLLEKNLKGSATSEAYDGVINDTFNCSRNGTRCVYGYWRKP